MTLLRYRRHRRYHPKLGPIGMSRRASAFTETDVKRAIRAVRAAGEVPGRVHLDTRTGLITVDVVGGGRKEIPTAGEQPQVNPWDDV
jgi:hypothetical protein